MSTIPETGLWVFSGSIQDGRQIVHALEIVKNMLVALDTPTDGVQLTLDAVVQSLMDD
jgi:ABC-type phosphonate transport system ATPase subunit